MGLIFYKRILIKTSLSTDQAFQLMAAVVMPDEYRFFMFPKHSGRLVGKITREGFAAIEQGTSGRSSFPYISGKFLPSASGTQIDVAFRLQTPVIVVLTFFTVLWSYLSFTNGLLFLFPLVLMWAATLIFYDIELERSEKRIRGIFDPYTIR